MVQDVIYFEVFILLCNCGVDEAIAVSDRAHLAQALLGCASKSCVQVLPVCLHIEWMRKSGLGAILMQTK